MSDIQITVEGNIDRLSAGAVHRLFGDLASRLLKRGEELLRVNVPRDTGAMAEHVGHSGPHEAGGVIKGAVGIPPIGGENRRFQVGTKDLFTPGEQSSSNYPLFVDRGTGIFGPAHAPIHSRRAHVMRFDVAEGTLFRAEVKGQPPQHFMLDTYEQMIHTLLPIESAIFGNRVRMLAVGESPPVELP